MRPLLAIAFLFATMTASLAGPAFGETPVARRTADRNVHLEVQKAALAFQFAAARRQITLRSLGPNSRFIASSLSSSIDEFNVRRHN